MSTKQLVWITGASQGIGRALALELARRGHIVAASARNTQALHDLADAANALPGAIHPYTADVTDRHAVANTHRAITTTLGNVHIAVLNAGTHITTPVDHFVSHDIEKLLRLNVMGSVYGLEVLLPAMRVQGGGRIAVVASLAGYRGLPTAAGYGASKAALINLCEALRLELHGSGINIQVINPGFVKTPLTDRNPFAMPFLISAESAARRIADGLQSKRFEIRFPRRLAYIMSLLQYCPHRLYALLIRKKTTDGT